MIFDLFIQGFHYTYIYSCVCKFV